MNNLMLLCFVCLYIGIVNGLYDRKSDVISLNSNNFDARVKDSDGIWIVEFYAPWCGHCKQLAPHYNKAASALKGIIGVGGVNCDDEKSLCSEFGVKGFPTIKIFSANKKVPVDFNGAHTAEGIKDGAVQAAIELISKRLGGGSGGGSSGGGNKAVVELTDDNFKKTVVQSEEPWLVEFFAPWCGHCKQLEPHWAKAAKELKGQFKLGAVDVTVHQSLAHKYNIKGYPTLKYFPAGINSDPVDYDGGRTASDIVAWAKERVELNVPAPEIVQAVDPSIMDDNCYKKSLCVIAYLPHILDCDAACRNSYLKTLLKLGDKFKRQGWGWIWMEGGSQPDFETSNDVGGFGYPALTVLNSKKMKYSSLTGSFSFDGIKEFLRDLSYGKGRTNSLRGASLVELSVTEPWDGKDGVLPEEEKEEL